MISYRATQVSPEPLNYFLQTSDEGPRLRVADVLLRENKDPKEIFARLIRFATNSHWSHSSLLYMLNNPLQGFDNTFLVEAMTSGVRVSSWKKEVEPAQRFTVAIKRLPMDWYIETPQETRCRDRNDPEDVPGISYLRQVRGIALDQIDGLYDQEVVHELTALYLERVFKRHLGAIPEFANFAASLATRFRKKDDEHAAHAQVQRFICSGLVQYSFFEALRLRISYDLDIPEHREAALSNLSNLHRVIFHPDPDGVIEHYVQQVKSGKIDIKRKASDSVLDLLKTATPADFNNSPNLEWRYVILQGVVWQIDQAEEGYRAQSPEEQEVLELIMPEHNN